MVANAFNPNQYFGGRGRKVSMSLRLSWSTSSKFQDNLCYTEKHYLGKKKEGREEEMLA